MNFKRGSQKIGFPAKPSKGGEKPGCPGFSILAGAMF